MPQRDDLERALDHRAVVLGGDGGGVVTGVEHKDQAAAVAGPDLLHLVQASSGRHIGHHGVDAHLGQARPVLGGAELGHPVGAQQRPQGDRQRGVAAEENNVVAHASGAPTWRRWQRFA
jgi:hypothetical protein